MGVYRIYSYIFIHIQFMFSCWMYFYEILTRAETDRHSRSMLLGRLQNSGINTSILAAVWLAGVRMCVRVNVWVHMCVCEAFHGPPPPWEKLFLNDHLSSSFGLAFGFLCNSLRSQRHQPQFLCVCVALVSSWIFWDFLFFFFFFSLVLGVFVFVFFLFLFSNNGLKQLLEYCPYEAGSLM